MAETVVDAADGRVVAVGIVDAAGAVDAAAVGDGIAGAAGRAGEDTKNLLPRICADSHGYRKGHGDSRGLFHFAKVFPTRLRAGRLKEY